MVSTHSRAEAAACGIAGVKAIVSGFNTQPRGGGCAFTIMFYPLFLQSFNTQPRGGGCTPAPRIAYHQLTVSTHSRAEAAAALHKH